MIARGRLFAAAALMIFDAIGYSFGATAMARRTVVSGRELKRKICPGQTAGSPPHCSLCRVTQREDFE